MFSIMAQNRRRGWQNFEKKNWQGASRDSFFSKFKISGLKISVCGLKISISGLKISISGLKISINGLKISINGLKISISGLKIWISGLKILIFGLKIWISSLNISISGQRNSGPPPKEWFQILAPPEGMVPNFEPKNDLKKGQICVFGSFLGPNGPFRLFSHHILCPTGLMKE